MESGRSPASVGAAPRVRPTQLSSLVPPSLVSRNFLRYHFDQLVLLCLHRSRSKDANSAELARS